MAFTCSELCFRARCPGPKHECLQVHWPLLLHNDLILQECVHCLHMRMHSIMLPMLVSRIGASVMCAEDVARGPASAS